MKTMNKIQQRLYDRVLKAAEYIQRIRGFGTHDEPKIIEVYKKTGDE